MKFQVFKTKKEASLAAAKRAAKIINQATKSKGQANLIVATGKSQLDLLNFLVKDKSVDWSKVELFHLDEYLGLSENHKASFRKYLKERLINKVHPGKVHLINGTAKSAQKECQRLNKIISKKKIDLVFLGIGENGHLAFNDPPADFQTEKPFAVVKLSDTNRKQQLKEKWFTKLSAVPKQAISMSIKQIIKSEQMILLAFGKRKAQIVQECLAGQVTPFCPASILKRHPKALVYLDQEADSLLKK